MDVKKTNPVEMAESYSLAGLFQQIVQDSKVGLPLFDELINKTSKLHNQIKVTITALGAFLDTFQKIADSASNTKGSSRDIGICLTRIVIRHKSVEAHMKTLANTLIDGFMFPIQSKTDDWKKAITRLDKEHSNEFKKVRMNIKRKTEYVFKLRKKYRKEPSQQLNIQIEQATQDLNVKYQVLEEQERQAVRRINTQERSHYCTLAACLKPVIKEEFTLLNEIQHLDQVMDRLGKIVADPSNIPDNYISEMAGESYSFATPPESPGGSALGSRRGSLRSISSLASSTPSSVVSFTDDATAKFKSCNKRFSTLSHHSQDSGFTSQDFIIQRNTSPQSLCNKDLADQRGRPHTISSSYNGAHSRPPVSGHTFSPLKSSGCADKGTGDSVSSCPGQSVYSTVRRAHSPFRRSLDNNAGANKPVTRRPPLPRRCNSVDRPPVPQRSSSLERPLTAKDDEVKHGPRNPHGEDAVKYGPRDPHYATPRNNVAVNSVFKIDPAREADRSDFYPSQPVYMNSQDSNGILNDTSPGFEEDLKTPTVEEMSFPGCKTEDTSSSSSGSSSGYGSQIAVMSIQHQPQNYTNDCPVSPRSTNTILRRKCDGSSSLPAVPARQTTTPVDLDEVTPHGSIEKFPPPPVHVLTSQGQQIYAKSTKDKAQPKQLHQQLTDNSLDKADRDISEMLSDLNNKLSNRVVRSSPNSGVRVVCASPNSSVRVMCSSPASSSRVVSSNPASTNRGVCQSPTSARRLTSPNSSVRVVSADSSPNSTIRVVSFVDSSPDSSMRVVDSSPNSTIKRSNSIGVTSVRPVERPELKFSTISQEDKANLIRALNQKLSPQNPVAMCGIKTPHGLEAKFGPKTPHVLHLPVNNDTAAALDPNLYKFGSKNLSLGEGSSKLSKTCGHSAQNSHLPKSLDLVSPEGEQYGFGLKFKENRVNYFGNNQPKLSSCTQPKLSSCTQSKLSSNKREKQVCSLLPH